MTWDSGDLIYRTEVGDGRTVTRSFNVAASPSANPVYWAILMHYA
jgi:hypothetical protein